PVGAAAIKSGVPYGVETAVKLGRLFKEATGSEGALLANLARKLAPGQAAAGTRRLKAANRQGLHVTPAEGTGNNLIAQMEGGIRNEESVGKIYQNKMTRKG